MIDQAMGRYLKPAGRLEVAVATISTSAGEHCNYVHCNIAGTYYLKTVDTDSWIAYEMLAGVDYWIAAIQVASADDGTVITLNDVVFCYPE
jgi:hypothetical protein